MRGGISVAESSARIVLVTGASSGFGHAVAMGLAARGYHVYGTSRGAVMPRTGEASPERPSLPVMIPMDVRSDASVDAAVGHILGRHGRIDVVLNNAGFGIAGAVEDTSVEEMQRQFDTNVFGVLRVCRAVLPYMRRQGGGRIINVSSLGGLIALPFQGAYSASKFALEALTETLRMETRPFGILVSLLEPGDFRTGFTANRVRTEASRTNAAYGERFARALGVMEQEESRGPGPEALIPLVERIIEARAPRLRYTAGAPLQRAAAVLRRFLPASLFERVIMAAYGIR
jgi:NAD(P)-dependent dehydrogenase (short-subunit alcohol dehydrogenase family)